MKGLSCHVACGILPEHGWNLCPLHWEVDSQPLDYQGSLEFCIFKRSFWKMQREGVEELLSLFLSCSACKRTGTSSLKLSLMIFAHRGELYSFVHLINPFYSCHSSRHTAPWAWPMPRMTMYCRVNNNWLISLKTRLWALRSRIMSFILYYPQHLASLLSHSRFSMVFVAALGKPKEKKCQYSWWMEMGILDHRCNLIFYTIIEIWLH